MADAPQTVPTVKSSGNPVGLIIAAWLASAVGLTLWPQAAGPLTFVFVALGWVLAVGVHEFCHAWVAYKAGDWTIVGKGYLTFDPRKYADLQTTLIFPLIALALGGIGFPGGAVYLRNDLMRTPLWRSAASLAGPGGTLAVLLALSAMIALAMANQVSPALVQALGFLALLQATALVLNLIPVPGFDGYGAVRPFLPNSAQLGLRKFEGLAPLLLLAVVFLVPGVSQLLFDGAFAITDTLRLPPDLMIAGLHNFQFWKP